MGICIDITDVVSWINTFQPEALYKIFPQYMLQANFLQFRFGSKEINQKSRTFKGKSLNFIEIIKSFCLILMRFGTNKLR